MGEFDPSEKELNILSKFHYEAAMLFGNRVRVKFVEDTVLDLYHDPEYNFSEIGELDIILNERPDKKLLRSLNWFNEEEDILPLIAYISKEDWEEKDIDLVKGIQLEIDYKINSYEDYKRFEISDVKAVSPGPLLWICKLVPVREEYDNEVEDYENQDEGYKYLKVDQEDSPEQVN